MLGHFYFSPFRDRILLTNDTGNHAFLSKADFGRFIKEDPRLDETVHLELQDRLFCSNESAESFIRRCKNEYREGTRYLFEPTSLFIFAITNECNNRCTYCQANGMGAIRRMSPAVIDCALSRIARCPTENLTIEFQGGEPLAHFEGIRYTVTRAWEILAEKKVTFTLVSNLALLTDEMARFIQENHISVSTSMDGPAALHDENRPSANGQSSFYAMQQGRKRLAEYGISAGAIQTTTKASLAFPREIVQSYVEQGFGQIFLRPLTRLGAAAKHWDEVGYEPEAFLAFYQAALDEVLQYNRKGTRLVEYHAALFLSKILRGRAVNYMELRSPCGAALGQMAITSSGNVYTCDEGRMLAESGDESFALGNVFENGYDEWISSACCQSVASASLLDTLPGCCDCVYKPYCGVCPVVNHAINGSITRVSRARCQIYKGMLDTLFDLLYTADDETMKILNEWSNQV